MSDNNFEMETKSKSEAQNDLNIGGGPGRSSKYEPVAQKYTEIDDDEAIVLRDLSQSDVQNLRNLLYRRFGKEQIIVRSSSQDADGNQYKAVVRDRQGDEYLRKEDKSSSNSESTSETTSEDTDESSDDEDKDDSDIEDEVEDVF